jgi:GDP-L-fucose synthase
MLHDGPPHNSNDTYAYSKRMLEIHCRAYRENYGDNFICVTPTNIYGPHDNFDLEDGHVIPSLVHKCYISKEKNIDFVIKGSGNALRQFIYSSDLGKLIVEILLSNNNESNIILSVGEDEEISIKDIAIIIAKSFDYENRIVFDTNYSDGQYKKTVSNKKILEKIPDFKFINMNDGIKKTVLWFIDNKK